MRWTILCSLLVISGTACKASVPLAPKAIELNQSGEAAIAAGDLVTAEARIALALEYSDRFVEAWVNLGVIELRRGNLAQAEKHFKRARDINPDIPTPHHGLGTLFDKRQMRKPAEANYRAALKVDPGFTPARINLARDLFADGAYDDAQEQFLRLTQVSPDTREGWFGLVECLWKLNRRGDADAVLENARVRFGEDVLELKFLVARRMLQDELYDDAEALLGEVTTHADAGRRAAAWAWTAFARLGRAEVDGAIEASSNALRIERDQSVATYAMGLALQMRGDPHANTWLERSHQLAPQNPFLKAAGGDR